MTLTETDQPRLKLTRTPSKINVLDTYLSTGQVKLTERDAGVSPAYPPSTVASLGETPRPRCLIEVLTVPQKKCQLREDGTVAVEALVELQPSGETKEVAFTTTPKIAPGGRSVVLSDIQYQPGKEISEDLTQAFLDKAAKMLDLRNFEKKGLALRIHRLTVEAGQITLLAVANIIQFPTL